MPHVCPPPGTPTSHPHAHYKHTRSVPTCNRLLCSFPHPTPTPQTQVFALQRQLSDANASSAEIRASSAALMDLVGEGPALQAMLNCYSHKIRLDQSLLLKQHTAGGVGLGEGL